MGQKVVLSISGKGGVGKTTVTALILKGLLDRSSKSILVVDADPATNLPEVLGVKIGRTVGMVVDDLKRKIDRGELPPAATKKELLEGGIHNVLVETSRFDLLAMGRSEGEGCYCTVNYLLASIIDSLSRNYDLTIMDMEAGLEHLSRRTDRDVDILLVVTDTSRMGFQTALRIREVAEEVHIDFKSIFLVLNQLRSGHEDDFGRRAEEIGIELVGIIPSDPNIEFYNLVGRPLLKLPEDSPAYVSVVKMIERLGLIDTRCN
ncbi:MAG: ATP-binding protein [Candidatus Bathyarchaeia archaeon]